MKTLQPSRLVQVGVHKLINITGKKCEEHVFEELQLAPQNDFSSSGFRLNKCGTVNEVPLLFNVFLPLYSRICNRK